MIPGWLMRTGVVIVVLIGAYAAGYHTGGKVARDAHRRDYVEGTQDADEALDDVRSRGAIDWLRDTFGRAGGGNP